MNEGTYFNIAQQLANKGTCRRRNYGAVIANNDGIISIGHSSSPVGCKQCSETGCKREELGIPSGERYELCRSIHAEQMALCNAEPSLIKGSILFLVGIDRLGYVLDDPKVCDMCRKLLLHFGVKRVYKKTLSGLVISELVEDYSKSI